MSRYSDWQKGIVNRNYHVLHTLAQDERVGKILAVDFLPFNFKRKLKTFVADQILRDTQGEVIYGDLNSRCWQVTSKIYVYSSINKFSRVLDELNLISKKLELKEVIVWNYNPFLNNYFNQLGQRLNIFDSVDNWLEHSSYTKYKDRLAVNYQEIKRNSDLIFTVSQNLMDLFDRENYVYQIPNGVELEHFDTNKVSDKLKDIKKPIIGFLGVMQDRLDVDLIKYLAEVFANKSIVLAGPVWKNFSKDKLVKYPNIHFLGQISYQEIPELYNGFDVGIIPYKVNEFIKSTDSMKFYEYLAAGLPVVSTDIAGADKFQNFIKIAKTHFEFKKEIEEILQQKKFKNPAIKSFLYDHTWQKRVGEMMELIEGKISNLN